MSRFVDAPRFSRTKRLAVAGTAVLAFAGAGCSSSAEGGDRNTPSLTGSPTTSAAPRIETPLPLSDPQSCLGSEDATIVVKPGKFSLSQNGPSEIIVCDLTGKGLPGQEDALANVLAGATCIPDDSRQTRVFAYPQEPPVTYGFPVIDSECLNNAQGTVFSPPASPTRTI